MATADDTIFRFLVEHSPDGHFVAIDGDFVYLNASAAHMFGFEDPASAKLSVKDILHPSEHERGSRNLALRASGVLRGSTTYLARRKDGTTFPIEVHAAPLDWKGRRGIHGVIRDITARRKMEERLEQMERTSLVARLAAGLAHDFNNLLAVIQTNADVALREIGRGSALEAPLQRIRVAVQRGGQRVRQIQQMRGPTVATVEFRPLHTNALVEEVLDLTRPRWQDEAESRGVRYDIRWEPGDPPPMDGSPGDLRAALVAILFNALEAMPDGGPITIRTSETADGEACITVRDEGEGIQRENFGRLTDAFFTTRADRKMGLGLHMVQQVLDRHGGRLDVDSIRGQGSTIALVLPAADEAPSDPPPPPRTDLRGDVRSQPTVPEPERPRTRGGRSILLIDDQADLVQVVRTILEGRGFSVDTALNGREGVALADVTRYSLVLTDLGMPDMSGWEVADRVKEAQPETPVVLTTGWAADIPLDRLQEHGIVGLLPKPFRSDQLLATVKKALDGSGAE